MAKENSCVDFTPIKPENGQPFGACHFPVDFDFPYIPYPVQTELMQKVWQALEEKKIGIFESPTGTGKSLSLICASLTWLRHFEVARQAEISRLFAAEANIADNDADWLKVQVESLKLKEQRDRAKHERERIALQEERLKKLRDGLAVRQRFPGKEKRKSAAAQNDVDDETLSASVEEARLAIDEVDDELVSEDSNMILLEYNSDDENGGKSSAKPDNVAEDNEDVYVPKIFYCSRTHSQLAQFLAEVRKTSFASSLRVVTLGSRQNLCVNEDVRRLGSLGLMNDRCNELQKNTKPSDADSSLAKLAKATAKSGITEGKRRQRMQRQNKCPFYQQLAIQELADHFLIRVQDVEEMVSTAAEVNACPYFASRRSVASANLVLLPYNMLIHKSTREACNVRLEDSVVIIDEAHNLMDSISAIHSFEVSSGQLCCAISQLTEYMKKFQTRLKAKNLIYCRQLLQVLHSLLKFLSAPEKAVASQANKSMQESKAYTINSFVFEAKLEEVNFFKLVNYLMKSELPKKLRGFTDKYLSSVAVATNGDSTAVAADNSVTLNSSEEQAKANASSLSNLRSFLSDLSSTKQTTSKRSTPLQSAQTKPVHSSAAKVVPTNATANSSQSVCGSSTASALACIQSFLDCLSNSSKDGRIIAYRLPNSAQSRLKFLLLNPAVYFQEIVDSARAIVLAGGTMQPVSELTDLLFKPCRVPDSRFLHLSCAHVIPKNNLLSLILKKGPTGQPLELTYENRGSTSTTPELSRILLNVASVVPDGLICFFPSYDAENRFYDQLKSDGSLAKLESKKKLFREQRSATSAKAAESILDNYSSCVRKLVHQRVQQIPGALSGAVLFAVVGGKLSEGINFADELGRCVIVFGMPYPNVNSPELKEKMAYLNVECVRDSHRPSPGQLYYENLCMKAVNQSIGRVIRHRADFATIILADARYARTSVLNKLPEWIRSSTQTEENFGPFIAKIRKFFLAKECVQS